MEPTLLQVSAGQRSRSTDSLKAGLLSKLPQLVLLPLLLVMQKLVLNPSREFQLLLVLSVQLGTVPANK